MKAEPKSLLLSLFSFIGGFFSLLFTIGLLQLFQAFDSFEKSLFLSISGHLISFGALFLNRNKTRISFFDGLFLSLYFVSKVFFLYTVYIYAKAPHLWAYYLLFSALLEGVGLYFLLQPTIQFISPNLVLGFLFFFFQEIQFPVLSSILPFGSLVFTLYCFRTIPFSLENRLRSISLSIGVFVFFSQISVSILDESSIVLALLVGLLLFVYILDRLDFRIKNPRTLALAFILVLFTYANRYSPGILVSTYLLFVSFFKTDWAIRILSYLGFVLFFSLYYYNLEVTLLIKSAYLLGTGLLLLGVSFLLPYISKQFEGWAKG